MTRALRITHWPHPDMPTMVCMLEGDMKVSAEQAVEEMLHAGHGFFTYAIFDVEDGADIPEVTLAAVNEAKGTENDERNMAIAYQWYVNWLSRLSPGGTIAGTEPAPLSREQVAWVLRSVAQSPVYDHQNFHVPLEDGTFIEMKRGEVLPR